MRGHVSVHSITTSASSDGQPNRLPPWWLSPGFFEGLRRQFEHLSKEDQKTFARRLQDLLATLDGVHR